MNANEGFLVPAFAKAVLELTVLNHSGVMSHVCGLFARRAFNMEGILCMPVAIENAWLPGDGVGGPLDDLLGSSITYRIAVGPRSGQKLFTLQTVPPRLQGLLAWRRAPADGRRAGTR